MPKPSPSLLLLAPPPVPITSASLAAAYRPSIIAAVSILKELPTSAQLMIGLPCPAVHARLRGPRSQVYNELQRSLASLYSLVCIVCANLGVDVESDTPGSIDARILLLDYDGSQHLAAEGELRPDNFMAGPIVDLPTLALTRRRWNIIFAVDGEEGQKIFTAYSKLANRQTPPLYGHVRTIGGGVSLIQKEELVPRQSTSDSVHNVVAVGGTFDHLHAGHKLLLTATALLLQPASISSVARRRLIVGITGDELLKNKKYAEYLSSWTQRQEDVVDFLLSILHFAQESQEAAIETISFDEPIPNGRAIHTKLKNCSIVIECVEIQDPFGPTITDESVTALVVSGETRSGGKAVNEKREQKGWKRLDVFEVDVLNAEETEQGASQTENFASKISSTAIRKRRAEIARTSSL
ncbi:pantetheine-phosphate adenylyltransferase family protein-like protein [Stipitochalara longipes BDJ]|nr:pantetheine-phosphate adenylyltransferase family protein-like protein [Stipitochalara longipes BDJ]